MSNSQVVKYVVYNPDGKIKRSGMCAEKDLILQADNNGEIVMRCSERIDDRLQEVHEGIIREIPGIKQKIEVWQEAVKAKELERQNKIQAGDIDSCKDLEELKQVLKKLLEKN